MVLCVQLLYPKGPAGQGTYFLADFAACASARAIFSAGVNDQSRAIEAGMSTLQCKKDKSGTRPKTSCAVISYLDCDIAGRDADGLPLLEAGGVDETPIAGVAGAAMALLAPPKAPSKKSSSITTGAAAGAEFAAFTGITTGDKEAEAALGCGKVAKPVALGDLLGELVKPKIAERSLGFVARAISAEPVKFKSPVRSVLAVLPRLLEGGVLSGVDDLELVPEPEPDRDDLIELELDASNLDIESSTSGANLKDCEPVRLMVLPARRTPRCGRGACACA